jgi:amino acid transporter
VAVAAAAQVATARLMYGMARDGRLPRPLAQVNPRRQVPQRAILLVAFVNLVTGLVFAQEFELLTTLVCFGALVGFLLLHLSVLVHFGWRQKSGRWMLHVVVPLVGAAITAYVLWNMARNAQLVGAAWLAIGIAATFAARLFRRAGS